MALGMGIGVAHATRPPPRILDFRTAAASFGVTVPAGCAYTRAACVSTVQTGTSGLVDLSAFSGTANLVVSGRADDAWEYGLLLGEARTNLVTYGRDFSNAAWTKVTSSGPSYGAATSPFGGTGATLVSVPITTGILAETTASGVVAGNVTASWWHLGAASNSNLFTTGDGLRTGTTLGSVSVWSRLSITRASGSNTSAIVLADGRDWTASGGLAAAAYSATFDAAQREAGNYPDEYIPTAGATATRNASFARALSAFWSPQILGGRVGIERAFRPKGARAEYTGVRYLWWSDANNNVAFDAATGVITVTVAGASNTTSAITWNRYASLRVYVETGGGLATYVAVLIDGARTVPSITGSALGTVPAGDLYLGSSDTTGHTCAWNYRRGFYAPGPRPGLAW